MKNKQLLLMLCALLVSISFFLPWASIDPNFDTFASSDASINGLTLITGINMGVQMISAFGQAYGFPFPGQVLYLAYFILLIPILGILGFILLGLRNEKGVLLIRIQTIIAILFVLALWGTANFNEDMRLLVNNILDYQFGLPIMFVASILGFVFSLLMRKERRRHV